jgi:hypothetical protein
MTGLLRESTTITRVRLWGLSAGSDARRFDVILTETDAVAILSESIGTDGRLRRVLVMPPVRQIRPSPSARCGAIRQGLRSMMPVLSMRKVGRYRPQLCAWESRAFIFGVVST